MPTQRQLQIINQYREMMEEAKLRLASIDAALSGLITIIPLPGLREFCFLQLRMLTELIALACLVAHGDIRETKTKKLLETWEPDRILAALEKLHPGFFPLAVQDAPPEPGINRHLVPLEAEHLSKAELTRLYAMSGGQLHRGSIRSLFGKTRGYPADHADIRQWQRKITALLRMHFIALLDPDVKILCVLAAADYKNATHVAIAESIHDPS
jgi:hypothetical protein